jgi:IS605 OrfB family transposase
MRKIAHGVVWFEPSVELRVLELMKLQCSAVRSAYQAYHKHDLTGNDVKLHVKKNYYPELNQRYVSDACSLASGMVFDNVLFGGKKMWEAMVSGNLDKEDWNAKRNSQLYSMGDKSKNGNPNIRVDGGRLLVNDPSDRGLWLEGKLFIPKKFANLDLICYDVRIVRKDDKFEVKIGWNVEPGAKQPTVPGAIGVDCNPDGLAVVEVDADGNLLKHKYLLGERLQFASNGKRIYDVRMMAKEVVGVAKASGKALVIEDLDFGKDKKKKDKGKKFNRMKSNFVHDKLLESLRSRSEKEGVPLVEVDPAYTSILGNLKYKSMYSLNRHTAAGMVIARRGMGIKERKTFTDKIAKRKVPSVNLEGRSGKETLTLESWSYFRDKFLKMKKPRLTASPLAPPHGGTRGRDGGIPSGESNPTTGRVGVEF